MVSLPLLPRPVGTGVSAARRRHPRPPKAATVPAHLERKVASSGEPLYRRKVYRLPPGGGNFFFYDGRQFPSLTQVVS